MIFLSAIDHEEFESVFLSFSFSCLHPLPTAECLERIHLYSAYQFSICGVSLLANVPVPISLRPAHAGHSHRSVGHLEFPFSRLSFSSSRTIECYFAVVSFPLFFPNRVFSSCLTCILLRSCRCSYHRSLYHLTSHSFPFFVCSRRQPPRILSNMRTRAFFTCWVGSSEPKGAISTNDPAYHSQSLNGRARLPFVIMSAG